MSAADQIDLARLDIRHAVMLNVSLRDASYGMSLRPKLSDDECRTLSHETIYSYEYLRNFYPRLEV